MRAKSSGPSPAPTSSRGGDIVGEGAELAARKEVPPHEPRVTITNCIAEDLPKELKRLDAALAKLRADLDRMLERGDV